MYEPNRLVPIKTSVSCVNVKNIIEFIDCSAPGYNARYVQ